MYGQHGLSIDRPNKPEQARRRIMGYMKGSEYIQVISGANSLSFSAAPLKALIDLRTMKLELIEIYNADTLQRYTVDEMIQHCNKL